MHHPQTRSERRYAREVWRDHRRKIIVTRYISRNADPTEYFGWFKGGKQYTGCGNRCECCTMTHYAERKQLKALRRQKVKVERPDELDSSGRSVLLKTIVPLRREP